jgi:endo-1,4-beta-xylanase
MMTRREWMRQAAGVTAVAAMPGLTSSGGLAQSSAKSRQAITGAESLKSHAAARGLLTGCAVNAKVFREDEGFRNLLAEQYNIVVPENCMKWNMLRPTAETYSFVDADGLVAFAEEHAMKVRGHNFVWHEALPGWFAGAVSKENAEKFLVDHIHTVGGRYRARSIRGMW